MVGLAPVDSQVRRDQCRLNGDAPGVEVEGNAFRERGIERDDNGLVRDALHRSQELRLAFANVDRGEIGSLFARLAGLGWPLAPQTASA